MTARRKRPRTGQVVPRRSMPVRRSDDWRSRSRRNYPLRADAVRTKPAPGLWVDGNPLMWEFAYFRAVARVGATAGLLGLAVPVAAAAVSLAAWFALADLGPVMIGVLLVAGALLVLPVSWGASFLRRRPYWQPGVVSLVLLGYAAGIPLMFAAQAFYHDFPRQSVPANVLDWATLQGLSVALGPTVAAIVWFPFAWRLYRNNRRLS